MIFVKNLKSRFFIFACWYPILLALFGEKAVYILHWIKVARACILKKKKKKERGGEMIRKETLKKENKKTKIGEEIQCHFPLPNWQSLFVCLFFSLTTRIFSLGELAMKWPLCLFSYPFWRACFQCLQKTSNLWNKWIFFLKCILRK